MNEIKLQEKNEIIVNALDGQAVTSSREVAKVFDKRHRDVLKAIRELIVKLERYAQNYDIPSMFRKSNWINSQNGEVYPEYTINRDGFTLLVMGFTGEKALEWKLKYIEAFNKMEQKLHERDPRIEIAHIIKDLPKSKLRYLSDLYPEYFTQPNPYSLEHTVDANSSYIEWIETLAIDKKYITSFPTKEIYNDYLRFCHNNRYISMGKKNFYKSLENDFRITKRQKSNGYRYFIAI